MKKKWIRRVRECIRRTNVVRMAQSGASNTSLEALEPRLLMSAEQFAASILEPHPAASATVSEVLVQDIGQDASQGDLEQSKHGLQTDEYIPPTYHVFQSDGYLTEASFADPLDIALDYLRSNAGEFGLSSDDLGDYVVTDRYVSEDVGVTHLYLNQTCNGLLVRDAVINANVTRDGRIVNIGSSFIAGLDSMVGDTITEPSLQADQALQGLSDELGWGVAGSFPVLGAENDVCRTTLLDSGSLTSEPVEAKLEYVPVAGGGVDLGWTLSIELSDGEHWYDLSVSAEDGRVLDCNDWVTHDASYDVYAVPTSSPSDGTRTLVVNPSDPTASPYGWHDVDGVAGAEYTTTQGNNVYAYADRNADNVADAGSSPSGGAGLTFDYALDLGQPPASYQAAAVTNLFYWNNILHDIHYQYGFTEAAGNFQSNNYGRGGTGNDYLLAEAQDGADVGNANNANFSTPPDGSRPRMQMYEWTRTSPSRDSDFDSGIIIHEYGHGVSNRLTGGPGNSGALSALQSGGMGEGWSDWWSLMLTQDGSGGPLDAYPVGTYVLGQSATGAGIRTQPYCYNMAVDNHTYGDVAENGQVHYTGEVWCSALWDLSCLLIYGDGGSISGQGFDPDLYDGTGGNNLALRLIMDGLKLQPANPTFLDGRDAILLADYLLTGGANQSAIWTAFARRGMGYSADDGGDPNSTAVTEAFDLPATSQGVVSLDRDGYIIGNTVHVKVRDMDLHGSGPISVTIQSSTGDSETVSLVESDVTAMGVFTGSIPTAQSSPLSGNGILSVSPGATLTVSYDDANDGTGSPAHLTDTATAWQATQVITSSLPAAEVDEPYSVTLQATGGSGSYAWSISSNQYRESSPTAESVTGGTAMNWRALDASYVLQLPWSFNFYGQSYTQVHVCTKGYLDFTSSATVWVNSTSGLISSTRIAALWDDLRTDGAGQDIFVDTSSADVVKIRWKGQTYATGTPVDFMVTLGRDGSIRFDYGAAHSGLTATIGISAGDGIHYTLAARDGATAIAANQASKFSSLPPGLALDSLTGQLTGTPLQGGTYPLTVSASDTSWPENSSSRSFLLTVSGGAEVHGTVWNDLDANGTRNAGEPGMAGRTVFLDQDRDGIPDPGEASILTLSDGSYAFTGLASGTYYVAEVQQSGWVQTSPATIPQTVTLAHDQVVSGVDLGNWMRPVPGTLDASFGVGGIVKTGDFFGSADSQFYGVAVQSDGKTVAVGESFAGGSYDFAVARYNVDGTLDTSFGGSGLVMIDVSGYGNSDSARSVAIQSDGKIVVAGQSGGSFGLVRLNADGSLDASFDGDGKVTTYFDNASAYGYSMAIQSNGKIVVAGYAYNYSGGSGADFVVARYNTNGSLDTSFSGDGKEMTAVGTGDDYGYGVAIQSDGRIVVAGAAYNGSNFDFAVVRYNSDGTLDTSFSGDGKQTTAVGSDYDYGYSVAIQSDGKIVVAGESYSGSTYYDFAVVRYNSDGSLDTSFSGDGVQTTAFGSSYDSGRSVAIQPNGKIVVAGYAYMGSSSYDFAVARYNSDGSLDTSFSGDGKQTTAVGSREDYGNAVAMQSDGRIVVAGSAYTGIRDDFAVVRYNADGTLDTSFSVDGKATTDSGDSGEYARGIAIQADGKVVVAGYVSLGNHNQFAVARYNTDGTLDSSFDGDGIATVDTGSSWSTGYSVAIQSDGKIVVAGQSGGSYALARLNADGSLDTSFDGDGKVVTYFDNASAGGYSVAIQSDGKIVVAGYSYNYSGGNSDFAVARYNANGSLDTSFSGDGKETTAIGTGSDYGYSVAIQSDGKIVAAGESYTGSGYYDFAVVRYNSDGTLDTSFSEDGKQTTAIGSDYDSGRSVAIQSDGKIVVAGYAYMGSSYYDFAVVRYNSDGSLDTSFSGDGKETTAVGSGYDYANSMAIQSDGKIVVAGYAYIGGSNEDFAVVRYNSDGTLDTSFSGDGKEITAIGTGDAYGYAVAIQSDGKIVVAGESYEGSNVGFALARYNAAGGRMIYGLKWNDLDGDGIRDAGEPGLSGWTIYLDQDQDGVLDAGERSVVTGPDGNYTFLNVAAGTYYVAEIQQGGWLRSYPVTVPQVVSLVADGVASDVNFGSMLAIGQILGMEWNDLDGDGIKDAGEPGLEGRTIYLDQNQDGAFEAGERSTITGPDGSYAFTGLIVGTYYVSEVHQRGWARTYPSTVPQAVALTAGQVASNVDFGNKVSHVAEPLWVTLLSDGFEGSFPDGNWTLSGTPTWGATTYTAHTGSYSAYCVGSTIAAPGPYPNNAYATMVCGPFDLSDAADAKVDFWYRINSASNDSLAWCASVDGTNWAWWYVYGNGGTTWWKGEFDLKTVPGLGNVCGQSHVWIRFMFTSDSSVTNVGAFVDDVVVSKMIREDPYEENNTRDAAWDLRPAEGQWLSSYGGSRGIQNDDDWYQIEATSDNQPLFAQCSFLKDAGTMDMELYDSGGDLVAVSTGSGGVKEISVTAETAGMYYVRVHGDNTADYYNLFWDRDALPAVSLENAVSTLPENTNTSSHVKVADIAVADDPRLDVLDDMEVYDGANPVYAGWEDGLGYSNPAPGSAGNGTGSIVGHDYSPYVEQGTSHGGMQSLPFYYDNSFGPFYSEISHTFDASSRDWTAQKATDLSLWLKGRPASYAETTSGQVVMNAQGADIWGTSDQFVYAYQSLDGDGSIIARVDSLDNTDGWAKAGVMIRGSLDANAAFAAVYATPANGVRFQARSAAGGQASSDSAGVSLIAPVWIKLERIGNTFNGYYSSDGVTWTSMSWGPQTISLTGTVYVGLALTSHNAARTCEAEFSQVTRTGNVVGQVQVAEIGIKQPNNAPGDLYVGVEDGAGHIGIVTYPDPEILTATSWTEWRISLSELAAAGVDLSNVDRMFIGVGDRDNPQADGSGLIYVDDVELYSLPTVTLSLSGTDQALFEISGTGLYLKAGTVLDHETNPQLDVTVAVDDPTIGSTPDSTASLPIAITEVETPVVFADANLKAAVKTALGITTDPTPTQMLGLTSLTAENLGITSLTGLECATNLNFLSLSSNQISDVSALSGLTNLRWLFLDFNRISDVSALSGLTSLASLGLWSNQISDISALSGMTSLSYLNLTLNQINDASALSGLTNLGWLSLGSNQVSDISALSGMTNLGTLYLHNNQVSDVSALSGMTNLTLLNLGANHVSDVSALSGLANLTLLDVGLNQVSDVSALSGMTNLGTLNLWSNQITDVSALSGMTDLTYLNLAANQIGDVSSLSGLTNLGWLDLNANHVSDVSVLSAMTNLTELYLGWNQISDVSALSGLTHLSILRLQSNPLNQAAYTIHIPQIQTNNPGISLEYDVPGQIQGAKWNDLDGDGTWDGGEPGLSGWTIYLDQDQDGALDAGEPSAVTASDGSYTIEYLSSQTYYTTEVGQSGWMRTYPSVVPQAVWLNAAQVVTDINFGNILATSQVHGSKWNDLDVDGVRDAGEPGLAGWTIYLDQDRDGTLDAGERSTVTGSDGSYAITGLTAGTYYAAEVQQAGWLRTCPTAASQTVTLAAGESVSDVNFGNAVFTSLILDAGAAGSSSTGTWVASSGSGNYGLAARYSGQAGATYSFRGSVAGPTEVALWWTAGSNRSTAVAVQIYDGTTLLDTKTINQQTSGSQWNVLGQYSFTGAAEVRIISTGGSQVTIADAARLTAVHSVAIGSSDGGRVSVPGEGSFGYAYGTVLPIAAVSEGLIFQGWTGTAVDAGKVADTSAVSTSLTVDGNYSLTAVFGTERIVDAGAAGSSSTGTWSPSGTAGNYGLPAKYSGQAGATYSFKGTLQGIAEVSLWWTAASNRSSAVSVEIYDGTTLLETKTINQQVSGSQWNVLGTYVFRSSNPEVRIISTGSGAITIADAAKFKVTVPAELIIDNGQTGTSSTGTWATSGAAGSYGGSALYSGQAGATYSFKVPVYGSVELSLWWTANTNRSDAVSVQIYNNGVLADTKVVNQKINGSQWNVLGQYNLAGPAEVRIISTGGSVVTMADALRVSAPRATYSTTIGSNDGGRVSVPGEGVYTYLQGEVVTIAAESEGLIFQNWTGTAVDAGRVGNPGLSSTSLTVGGNESLTAVFGGERIVDAGAAGSISAGTWATSTSSGYYGSAAKYSNVAGATYSFQSTVAAQVAVSLWWTAASNRSSAVTVQIYDGTNLVDTKVVNQQAGGSQWNTLGAYTFHGTAELRVISSGGGTVTIADAARFTVVTSPDELIMDTGITGTSRTGSWATSSTAGNYGSPALYSNQAGATYSFSAALVGTMEVSLWWTAASNRSDAVVVQVYNNGILLGSQVVNQKVNGSQWNVIGQYSFTGAAEIRIISTGGSITIADAARFQKVGGSGLVGLVLGDDDDDKDDLLIDLS